MKKIVVIGNGKMAVDCLKIMAATPGHSVSQVVTEPKELAPGNTLPGYCRKQEIACLETARLNTAEVIERVSAIAPDIIFNINSFKIIKPALLAIPKESTINFHNGPLPRYGGVNVCSWAIINGETSHGVTWHHVEEGIDTGDIVAQRHVDVAPDETAITLIMKCINAGTALFREIFPRLVGDGIVAEKQDRSKATYYSLKDIPNNGVVDYTWPFAQLDRFVRGLTFHPTPNTFVLPRSTCSSKDFYIQRVERVAEGSTPAACGTVAAIEPDRVIVQVGDSTAALTELLDENKNVMNPSDFADRYALRVGHRLGDR